MNEREVYVRGINASITPQQLAEEFQQVGRLTKCRFLPKSPNFDTVVGFVGYGTKAEAENAIRKFNGTFLFGHRLTVTISNSEPKRPAKVSPSSLSPEKPDGLKLRLNRPSAPVGMGRGRASIHVAQNVTSFQFDDDADDTASKSSFQSLSSRNVFTTPPKAAASMFNTRRLGFDETESDASELSRAQNFQERCDPRGAFPRKPRMSEPVSKQFHDAGFHGGDRAGSDKYRRSDGASSSNASSTNFTRYMATPENSQPPQVRPPSKVFTRGDKVRFVVDSGSIDLNDLSKDPNCLSENPIIFMDLHKHYSSMGRDRAFFAAKPPMKSTFVAAPYGDCYYRAEVLSVKQNSVEVYFIDYGNKEILDLSKDLIFPLEDKYIVMKPALFVKCRFGGSSRNQSIFESKVQLLAAGQISEVVLDGEVMEYNPDTKLCVLNIDGEKPIKDEMQNGLPFAKGDAAETIASSESSKAYLRESDVAKPTMETFINFNVFLKKETKCAVREALSVNLCVVCPEYLCDQLPAFEAMVNECKYYEPCSDVDLNDFVLAPYGASYYRAFVKELDANEAIVYFIDYGNSDKVPLSTLKLYGRNCPKEILTQPAFGIPCKIEGIKPKDGEQTFSEEAVKGMIDLLKGSDIFFYGIDVVEDETFGGKMLLIRMYSHSHSSFADHLISLGLVDRAGEVAPHAGNVRQKRPFLKDVGVNKCLSQTKTWLELGCLDITSPRNFTVICPDDLPRINEMGDQLKNSYSASVEPVSPSDLKIGHLVVGLSVEYEEFYRASVHRISRDFTKVKVCYIDYGNFETLPVDKLYHMKQEFLGIEPLVMHCCLRGFPEGRCDEEVTARMTALLKPEVNTLKKVKVKIDEVQPVEDSSLQPVAVVDIAIPNDNFGSTNVMEALGVTPCSSETSNGLGAQADSRRSPASNGRRNDVRKPKPNQDRQREEAVKQTPPSRAEPRVQEVILTEVDKDSPSYHVQLEARVRSLESKLAEAFNKIYEMEQLLYTVLHVKTED